MTDSQDTYFRIHVSEPPEHDFEFTVLRTPNGFKGVYEDSSDNLPIHEFDLTDADILELREQFERSQVNHWFCHYYSSKLPNEIIWDMEIDDLGYDRAHLFPLGLQELLIFLEDRFEVATYASDDAACARFNPAPYLNFLLYGNPGLHFLAENHRHLLTDADLEALVLEQGFSREEAQAKADWSFRQLTHDLRLLLEQKPVYKDYKIALRYHGIKNDAESISAFDVSSADSLTIASLMAALMESEGSQNDTYSLRILVADGTVTRWLRRLDEVTEEPNVDWS